jgi:hypothetical protein
MSRFGTPPAAVAGRFKVASQSAAPITTWAPYRFCNSAAPWSWSPCAWLMTTYLTSRGLRPTLVRPSMISGSVAQAKFVSMMMIPPLV